MDAAIAGLGAVPPGGRNTALNHAAWMPGRWDGAGALEQADVEDPLYAAAVANGLAANDGERQGLGHDQERSARGPAGQPL